MKIIDFSFFGPLVCNPYAAFELAKSDRDRMSLSGKTNAMLLAGVVLILSSQALQSVVLPLAIAMSLAGACCVLAAGWLQFTFKRRSKQR